jgi:hypothetical protein
MCVQYLPTVNVDWVKSHFDLALPTTSSHDIFPTYPGSPQSIAALITFSRFCGSSTVHERTP